MSQNGTRLSTFTFAPQSFTLGRKNRTYRSLLLSLMLMMLMLPVAAQERISTETYIETYKDIAIRKMEEYKIPASITLAQGILESGSGNSRLATQANNHFGIKCHKGWTGKTFIMDDDEKDECFRKYRQAEDSYRDHSLFLTQRGRYSFLFELPVTDYKAWANGLKKAGYATNPKYPELLIRIIEKYHLDQYDTAKPGKAKHTRTHKPVAAPTVMMSRDKFEKDERWPSGRQLYKNNGSVLLIVAPGDTFNKLAKEFGLYTWQLYKYNELGRDHVLKVDEIIYLDKKKRKAQKPYKTHEVQAGESMHDIAQLYGVRLSRLYKMNNLPEGVGVSTGKNIRLR